MSLLVLALLLAAGATGSEPPRYQGRPLVDVLSIPFLPTLGVRFRF